MSALYPAPGTVGVGVIGHRGACARAPENTLAALRLAAAGGARMVEVDVKLTADGRPVLFHDDRLERTSDGVGPMASTLLETVGALDAGSWFAPEFVGEPVPTLEETLDLALDLGLALNLEIKPCPGREAETARAVVAAVQQGWPLDGSRPLPLLSSFARASLAAARDAAPDLPRALIADPLPGDWAEAALILGVRACHLGDRGLTRATVDAVRAGGHAVAVWTVNDRARAGLLAAWGVAAVFTDDPAALLAPAVLPAMADGGSRPSPLGL